MITIRTSHPPPKKTKSNLTVHKETSFYQMSDTWFSYCQRRPISPSLHTYSSLYKWCQTGGSDCCFFLGQERWMWIGVAARVSWLCIVLSVVLLEPGLLEKNWVFWMAPFSFSYTVKAGNVKPLYQCSLLQFNAEYCLRILSWMDTSLYIVILMIAVNVDKEIGPHLLSYLSRIVNGY